MIARRPIRFVLVIVAGWIGVRVALLLRGPGFLPAVAEAIAPAARAETGARRGVKAPKSRPTLARPAQAANAPQELRPARQEVAIAPAPVPATATEAIPATASLPGPDPPTPALPPPPGAVAAPNVMTSRLSVSAWAIARADGDTRPFASQLGGSQAGLRVAYAIDRARRLALIARASAALGTRQTEVGLGVDWRPADLPIHLVAERRIGLEGVRGGYAVGAVGGFGPVPVAGIAEMEAYAQGGAIWRDGRPSGFVDGQARLTRSVARRGAGDLRAGVGTWGAAQEGAGRLDVGPSVEARVPLGSRLVRVAADWRQRVAGQHSRHRARRSRSARTSERREPCFGTQPRFRSFAPIGDMAWQMIGSWRSRC